jgi:hypothetical protein
MGIREEFTDAEWQKFLSIPYAVSLTIVTAAPTFWGAFGESKTLLTEPAKLAASTGSDLVCLLSGEMQSKVKDLIKQQQDLLKRDTSGFRSKTIEACKSASTILSKIIPEEAIAYKKWVLAIGQKVAEAAKEGGVAVSEPEKTILSGVSAAFGVIL